MKNYIFLVSVLSVLCGCATTPAPSAQLVSPIQLVHNSRGDASSDPVKGTTEFDIASQLGPLNASAALVGDIVYVHLRFRNTSTRPVGFGPEHISLADFDNTLIRSASVSEVVEPYNERTIELNTKATQAALAEREAQKNQKVFDRNNREQGLKQGNDTARDLSTTADSLNLLGALGALFAGTPAEQLQNQADASYAETTAVTRRIQSSALQSRLVPPGTITDGWVYFARPKGWPVTLRVLMNGQILGVSLKNLSDISTTASSIQKSEESSSAP